MTKKISIIAVVIILSFSSCKRHLPYPTAILKFTTDKGTLDESRDIDASYTVAKMPVTTGSDTASVSSNDSVVLIFNSGLNSGTGQGSAFISICHTYPKSILSYNNGSWYFKNDNDFLQALSNSLTPAQRGPFKSNTIYITLRPNTNSTQYSLLDNSNDPGTTISQSILGENYDWTPLTATAYPTSHLNPIALVKVSFSGRLVDASRNDTLNVQNLTFQGIFSNGK
jgi:hypothetical protein